MLFKKSFWRDDREVDGEKKEGGIDERRFEDKTRKMREESSENSVGRDESLLEPRSKRESD